MKFHSEMRLRPLVSQANRNTFAARVGALVEHVLWRGTLVSSSVRERWEQDCYLSPPA